MNDINSTVLIGRLVRDCGQQDFSYTQGGLARANISIAVNRSKKNGDQWVDEVSFFDLTLWGKTAENLHPYLTKGKQICVKGYLKQDRWEKDGQKYSKIQIVAEDIQLLGGKNDGTASGGQSTGYAPPNQGYAAPPADGDFPDDIPF